MALFFHEFYDALPRVTWFAQDDCVLHENPNATLQEKAQTCRILRTAEMGPGQFLSLTQAVEATPFEEDTCLCEVQLEVNFRLCPAELWLRAPTADDPPCYGDRYGHVVWLLQLAGQGGHGWADYLERTEAIRWPRAAQFAVPAAAVRSQPRAMYGVALALLDGLGADKFTKNASLTMSSPFTPGTSRSWPSFEFAHAFERAWFGILDSGYAARAERDVAAAIAQRLAYLRLEDARLQGGIQPEARLQVSCAGLCAQTLAPQPAASPRMSAPAPLWLLSPLPRPQVDRELRHYARKAAAAEAAAAMVSAQRHGGGHGGWRGRGGAEGGLHHGARHGSGAYHDAHAEALGLPASVGEEGRPRDGRRDARRDRGAHSGGGGGDSRARIAANAFFAQDN